MVKILNDTRDLRESICKLLEKYEDDIMKNTLGDYVDSDGNKYVEVYNLEWKYRSKNDISILLGKLLGYGANVNKTGLAYIIISELSGVMSFHDGDLNIDGLESVCEKILVELRSDKK